MNEQIGVDRLFKQIDKIDITNGVNQIRKEIYNLEALDPKKNNNRINSLKVRLNKLTKTSSFKMELNQLINQYNKARDISILYSAFYQCISILGDSKLKHTIYNQVYKNQSFVRNIINQIDDLFQKNVGTIVEVEKSIDGFEITSLSMFAEKYGYNLNDIKDSLISSFNEDILSSLEKYNSVSFNGLSLNIDNLSDIILNNRKKDNRDMPKKINIDPLQTENISSDRIFKEVYQKLEKINYLHGEQRLKISENEYIEIVSNIKEIIKIYQDIQLLIVTKEAFKDTQVSEYYPIIDQEVNKAHKQIINIYDKLNKYIIKIGSSDIFSEIVNSNVSVAKKEDEIKREIPNKEKQKTDENVHLKKGIDENIQRKNSNSVVSIIDSYKQQIALLEKTIDFVSLGKAQDHYNRVYDRNKGYLPPYGATFYKFLTSFYAGSDKMDKIIECERLKDELASYIYVLWKKSGVSMPFDRYAKDIQGVDIYSPSSYIENEKANSPIEEVESYVETKNKNIEEAKKRYNKKSSLWKFFNKKLNPEYLNFDNMTNNQIESLYSKGRH